MKGLLKKSYAILLALGLGYASAILCPPERGPEAPHITAARQTVEAHQEHVNRLQEESRAMEARHESKRTALDALKNSKVADFKNQNTQNYLKKQATTLGIRLPQDANLKEITGKAAYEHITKNLPTEDSLEKQHKRESAFANKRLSSALRDLSRSRNVLNSHLEQQAAAAPKRPGGLRRISDMPDAPSSFGTGQQQAPTAPKRPIGLRRISDMPDAPSGFDTSQQQAPESQWEQATGRRRTWKTVETPEYLEARRKAAEERGQNRRQTRYDREQARNKSERERQVSKTKKTAYFDTLDVQDGKRKGLVQHAEDLQTQESTINLLQRQLNQITGNRALDNLMNREDFKKLNLNIDPAELKINKKTAIKNALASREAIVREEITNVQDALDYVQNLSENNLTTQLDNIKTLLRTNTSNWTEDKLKKVGITNTDITPQSIAKIGDQLFLRFNAISDKLQEINDRKAQQQQDLQGIFPPADNNINLPQIPNMSTRDTAQTQQAEAELAGSGAGFEPPISAKEARHSAEGDLATEQMNMRRISRKPATIDEEDDFKLSTQAVQRTQDLLQRVQEQALTGTPLSQADLSEVQTEISNTIEQANLPQQVQADLISVVNNTPSVEKPSLLRKWLDSLQTALNHIGDFIANRYNDIANSYRILETQIDIWMQKRVLDELTLSQNRYASGTDRHIYFSNRLNDERGKLTKLESKLKDLEGTTPTVQSSKPVTSPQHILDPNLDGQEMMTISDAQKQ